MKSRRIGILNVFRVASFSLIYLFICGGAVVVSQAALSDPQGQRSPLQGKRDLVDAGRLSKETVFPCDGLPG